jgi:ribulose bisphosphate carboxylase small subunit
MVHDSEAEIQCWCVVEVDLKHHRPGYIRIRGFETTSKRLVLTFVAGKVSACWNDDGDGVADIPGDMVQFPMPGS